MQADVLNAKTFDEKLFDLFVEQIPFAMFGKNIKEKGSD